MQQVVAAHDRRRAADVDRDGARAGGRLNLALRVGLGAAGGQPDPHRLAGPLEGRDVGHRCGSAPT
eukprot:2471901-Prymnesium_polylepis.2